MARKVSTRNNTGYRGVMYRKKGTSYAGYIWLNGKFTYLGMYRDPKEAAKAYDQAAIDVFGEDAAINFKDY